MILKKTFLTCTALERKRSEVPIIDSEQTHNLRALFSYSAYLSVFIELFQIELFHQLLSGHVACNNGHL